MNRSYQQAFSQKKNSKTLQNDTTTLETLKPAQYNLKDETDDVFSASSRNAQNPTNIYDGYVKQAAGLSTRTLGKTYSLPIPSPPSDQGKIIACRVVDENEWQKLAKDNRSRYREPRPFKSLTESIRHNPTAIDHTKLNLVSSYITTLDKLPSKLSSRITTLYLSHNSLESLSGLEQFENITTASISSNAIRYLNDLLPLSLLPSLERLSLEGNIVTHMPYYREIVLGISLRGNKSGLNVLDGVKMTSAEKDGLGPNYRKACLQMDQMRCTALRVCVMEHLYGLTKCHAEIVQQVMGKFRLFILCLYPPPLPPLLNHHPSL
jgi:Leucine-rich repeat (LRR) protein